MNQDPPASNLTAPSNASKQDSDLDDIPEIMVDVAKKIAASRNVLIALSSDPSVDELATAIGLSLFLDRIGKRATAIYSGITPNVLEFLRPDQIFESSADVLQDFVIALNKEKADHLRYKLDGDFVKIFITPYKAKISQEDLSYSYGDFNVDTVLALDVANGADLDSALREHGRIMHDAVVINITTSSPGKLGEIEWSDENSSSVAEMIARLLFTVTDETIEPGEATAFLTGIVAATNRFSNAKTTPDTMDIASSLMRAGADQQLIARNITSAVDNDFFAQIRTDNDKSTDSKSTSDKIVGSKADAAPAQPQTPIVDEDITSASGSVKTTLSSAEAASTAAEPAAAKDAVPEDPANFHVTHPYTPLEPVSEPSSTTSSESSSESSAEPTPVASATPSIAPVETPAESASAAPSDVSIAPSAESPVTPPLETSATVSTVSTAPVEASPEASSAASAAEIDAAAKAMAAATSAVAAAVANVPETPADSEPAPKHEPLVEHKPAVSAASDAPTTLGSELSTENGYLQNGSGKTIQPSAEFALDAKKAAAAAAASKSASDATNASEAPTSPDAASDAASTAPVDSPAPSIDNLASTTSAGNSAPAFDIDNPAATAAPSVASAPEINGVPEINYNSPANGDLLPPPPAPPIDPTTSPMSMPPGFDNPAPSPAATDDAPEPAPIVVIPQSAPESTVSEASDPNAFKIPGLAS